MSKTNQTGKPNTAKHFLWLAYHYSGLRFIFRKFNPVDPLKSPATGVLWLMGLYVALFGIASQRYENRIDRIENRANGIYAQLGSKKWKQALERIPEAQAMVRPRKSSLIFTCDKEIKRSHNESRIEENTPEKQKEKKEIKNNLDCFFDTFLLPLVKSSAGSRNREFPKRGYYFF